MRSQDDSRTIAAARFARLLGRLHADADQAGLEYERLRRALVKFFDWRGAATPNECADETLDRLAKRLADETPIAEISQYAYGIARHVLLEHRRQPVVLSLGDAPELPAAPATRHDDETPLHDCFDRCLAGMSGESRSLVLQYYEGERHVKIANRRRMAAARALSDNALRSRVQRLRDGLEACVRACVSAPKRGAS